MARKRPQSYAGTVIDLQLAYRLIREKKVDPTAFGWIPHPCYLCRGSGRIKWSKDGSIHTCPKCCGDCYGPQGETLARPEFEILVGGAKGGGKSEVGRMFLIAGNRDAPNYTFDHNGQPIPNLINQSYVYHPQYRAVVIRRNEKELDEWIEKAKPLYRLLGGVFFGSGSAGEFRFPDPTGRGEWGAKIQTGHLADPHSYERYQGAEIHRIVIEELTHIEHFKNYVHLRSCCRSTIPEIKPQILCTTNPLGRGHVWVMERFIEPKDEEGRIIPPKTRIVERITHPYTGEVIEIDRVFIPANLRDNPSLLHDDAYVANLASLPDEKVRRAFLYGDWHIMSGQYFDMFRPDGPQPGEPANACHVVRFDPTLKNDSVTIIPDSTIDSVQWVRLAKSREESGKVPLSDGSSLSSWIDRSSPTLTPNLHTQVVKGGYPYLAPWWRRAIGLDWGYMHNAAAYWGCRNPETHQVHVYRELCETRLGSEELGARIAELTYDDLRAYPDFTVNLYVSPDAWRKTNVDAGIQSQVELIVLGMNKILGTGSIFVPGLDQSMLQHLEEHKLSTNFDAAYLDFLRRVSQHKKSGIKILRANNNRVVGWDWMRTMMNWDHPVNQLNQFDPLAYSRIAFERSMDEAVAYASMFSKDESVRPLLQIWDTCPKLRNSIPRAIHDENRPEDVDQTHFQDNDSSMDCIDGLRYLLVGFKDTRQEAPFEEQVRREVEKNKALVRNPHPLDGLWINRTLELKRAGKQTKDQGFTLRRSHEQLARASNLNRYMN